MAEGPLSGIEVLVHDLCHLSKDRSMAGRDSGSVGGQDGGHHHLGAAPPEDRVACSSWLGELTLKFSRELEERVAISRWHPLRGGEVQEG